MNSPFATQTQLEARTAARLDNPAQIRRALRLDNPFMHGVYTGSVPTVADRHDLPTPTYAA